MDKKIVLALGTEATIGLSCGELFFQKQGYFSPTNSYKFLILDLDLFSVRCR